MGQAVSACEEETLYSKGKRLFEEGSNDELAMHTLRLAFDEGCVAADRLIAIMLDNERGIPKLKTVKAVLKKNPNDAFSLHTLGNLYHFAFKHHNVARSLHYYQKAADLGYPPALAAVGIIYYCGVGVTRDFGKAVAYFQRAPEHPSALYWYAACFKEGHGVKRDLATGNALYLKAAQLGCPLSCAIVGTHLFDEGKFYEAALMLEKSEDEGARHLAQLKRSGKCVPWGRWQPNYDVHRWFPIEVRAAIQTLVVLRLQLTVVLPREISIEIAQYVATKNGW